MSQGATGRRVTLGDVPASPGNPAGAGNATTGNAIHLTSPHVFRASNSKRPSNFSFGGTDKSALARLSSATSTTSKSALARPSTTTSKSDRSSVPPA